MTLQEKQATDGTVIVFRRAFGFTATAGGTYISVFPSSDVTGAAEFGSANTLYTSYRVLRMDINYIPNVIGGNLSTLTYAPVFLVTDKYFNTALGSYDQAANYPSCTMNCLGERWTHTANMDGEPWSISVAVNQTVAPWYFKFYCTGLTTVSTYGEIIVEYTTQFFARQ